MASEAKAGRDQYRRDDHEQWFLEAGESSPFAMYFLVPQGPVDSHTDYKICYLNAKACRDLGVTPEQAIGQTLSSYLPFHRDSGLLELYSEVWSTGVARSEEVHVAFRGAEYWVRVQASRLKHGLAVWTEDVTASRRLKESLCSARHRENVGRLAGGFAHEVNNLLTVIAGYSEIASKEAEPESRAHQCCAKITDTTKRAAQLTAQMLAFTREQPTCATPSCAAQLLDSLKTLARPLLGHQVQLSVTPSESRLVAVFDSRQMLDVLVNLCANAAESMPEGGTIIIGAERTTRDDTSYIKITVQDHGDGMDDETAHHAFEPFFSTRSDDHHPGLGLPASESIVHQNGGSIHLSSQPGHGTIVEVLLPAYDGSEGEPKADTTGERGRSATILVAEDEPALLELAVNALGNEGHRVIAAENGEQALVASLERAFDIDVLVTDVIMPRLGGSKLVERIREHKPDIKVLYVSGYSENVMAYHGIGALGESFLQKPFGPSELVAAVRSMLEGS